MTGAEAMRRRALALRGPWWWRLACWASDRCSDMAAWLEPSDRSSLCWYADDGESVFFAQIRRPSDRPRADLRRVS